MALPEERKVYLDTAFQRLQQTREADELRKAKDEYLFQLKLCSNEVQVAANSIDEKIQQATADILRASQDQQRKALQDTIKVFQTKAVEIEVAIKKAGTNHEKKIAGLQEKLDSEAEDIRKTCEEISRRLQETEEQNRRHQEDTEQASERAEGELEGKMAKLDGVNKALESQIDIIHERMTKSRDEGSRLEELYRGHEGRLADMQTSVFKLLNKIDDYYMGLVEAKETIKSMEQRFAESQRSIHERLSQLEASQSRTTEKLEQSIKHLADAFNAEKEENRRNHEGAVVSESKLSNELFENKKLLLKMEEHYVQSLDAVQTEAESNEILLRRLESSVEEKLKDLEVKQEKGVHEVRVEFTEELAKMIERLKALTNEDHSKFVDFRTATDLHFIRLEEEQNRQNLETLNMVISQLDGKNERIAGESKLGEEKVVSMQSSVNKRLRDIDERLRKQAMNEGKRMHEFRRANATNTCELRELRREIDRITADIRAIHMSRLHQHAPITAGSLPPPPPASLSSDLGGSEVAVPVQQAVVCNGGPQTFLPVVNSVSDIDSPSKGSHVSSFYRQYPWNSSTREIPTMEVSVSSYYDRSMPVELGVSDQEIDKHESNQFSHCEYLRREIDSNGTMKSTCDVIDYD